jgi:hypothetical protein
MTIAYPVAASVEKALCAPLGFAMRERDAARLGPDEEIAFTSSWVLDAAPDEETAKAAVAARYGEKGALGLARGLAEGWLKLEPVGLVDGVQPKRPSGVLVPVKPVLEGGSRWPRPVDAPHRPKVGWRLSLRFWRLGEAPAGPSEPARKLRKKRDAEALERQHLQALVEQPLTAYSPQKALDIGLFEIIPPEAPHILMPDE